MKNSENEHIWDRIAHAYEEKFMDLNLYDDSYIAFLTALSTDQAHLLELGCGPGNITKYILSKKSGLQIEAIDYSSEMIRIAKQNNPTVKFQQMDIRDINNLTKRYDGIITGFSLPYLSMEEIAGLFSSVYHLLKEKGIFYLSFVEGDEEQSGYKYGSNGNKLYFHYYSTAEIKALLMNSGFMITDSFLYGYEVSEGKIDSHLVLIAKK